MTRAADGSASMPRLIWHDRSLWLYTYTSGGFEGYRTVFGRRRLAPDLRHYGRRVL